MYAHGKSPINLVFILLLRNFAPIMGKLIDNVKATMKSEDTEGRFELYVTRTPGYLWALLFRALHVHPITVTLMSIVIGAASGWCFFHDDMRWTLLGIFLLVWANWYDCADGQLARMTGQKTLIGRILDGFAGDVWFFSIYFFICLRLTPEWGCWIWLLGAWAGLRCHTRQCAIADYYRNIHLWFLLGKDGSELDTSHSLSQEYNRLGWNTREWFHKLYLFFYTRYTRGQEAQSPQFQALYTTLQRTSGCTIPEETRSCFRKGSLPLMPVTNILTFDTRVAVLFASLLAGIPWVYFVFEATILEWLRFRMIRRHEALCKEIHQNYITR